MGFKDDGGSGEECERVLMRVIEDVFWRVCNECFKAGFKVFEGGLDRGNVGSEGREMITAIGGAHFGKLFCFLTYICDDNGLYTEVH